MAQSQQLSKIPILRIRLNEAEMKNIVDNFIGSLQPREQMPEEHKLSFDNNAEEEDYQKIKEDFNKEVVDTSSRHDQEETNYQEDFEDYAVVNSQNRTLEVS